jgi:hypothetical protein
MAEDVSEGPVESGKSRALGPLDTFVTGKGPKTLTGCCGFSGSTLRGSLRSARAKVE